MEGAAVRWSRRCMDEQSPERVACGCELAAHDYRRRAAQARSAATRRAHHAGSASRAGSRQCRGRRTMGTRHAARRRRERHGGRRMAWWDRLSRRYTRWARMCSSWGRLAARRCGALRLGQGGQGVYMMNMGCVRVARSRRRTTARRGAFQPCGRARGGGRAERAWGCEQRADVGSSGMCMCSGHCRATLGAVLLGLTRLGACSRRPWQSGYIKSSQSLGGPPP